MDAVNSLLEIIEKFKFDDPNLESLRLKAQEELYQYQPNDKCENLMQLIKNALKQELKRNA